MSTQKYIYINLPGIKYKTKGPVWVDMVEIKVFSGEEELPIYTYIDNKWESMQEINPFRLYNKRYNSNPEGKKQQWRFFTQMSKDLGNGEFEHVIVSNEEQ
jgi:hypothetical protein